MIRSSSSLIEIVIVHIVTSLTSTFLSSPPAPRLTPEMASIRNKCCAWFHPRAIPFDRVVTIWLCLSSSESRTWPSHHASISLWNIFSDCSRFCRACSIMSRSRMLDRYTRTRAALRREKIKVLFLPRSLPIYFNNLYFKARPIYTHADVAPNRENKCPLRGAVELTLTLAP